MTEFFSGSEKKIGISVDGIRYLLKFQTKNEFGGIYNHVSEHLGSSIFAMLGFETQETILGIYKGENVVACKVFGDHENQFVPFNDVGDSSLDISGRREPYSYEGIMELLRQNRKLTRIEETVDVFWDMYVVDALLGNFDRHGANWGFLKRNNQYRLAPIFDNGSCLYPKMKDEAEMEHVLSSPEEIDRRIYQYPSSQIKLDGSRSSYYQVISSRMYPECNDAVLRMCPRISISKIDRLVDTIDCISETHRTFYKRMIGERYHKILLDTYRELNQ